MKKDIRSIIDDLGLSDIDFDGLKKLKFRRKKKSGRKWAILVLAVIGVAVAAQLYAKSRKS